MLTPIKRKSFGSSTNGPLGHFESVRLKNQGKRDGQHTLPQQNELGIWMSPFVHQEIERYNESCIFAWSELQSQYETKYQMLSRLCQQIPQQWEQLDRHRGDAPPPPDLTVRLKGEEGLCGYLVRNRRQREYEKRNASYFVKLYQLETDFNENYHHLSELNSEIQAVEKSTRMLCERTAGYITQRITTYWDGALKTHPKHKIIPPTPEITLVSNAETDYFNQNTEVIGKVKRLLALRENVIDDFDFATAIKKKEGRRYVSRR